MLEFAPSTFTPETTTVFRFADRGDWATHLGNYRGNWSPHIPRNLILRYTAPGDLVLDQMAGSGTTLVECKLLGRRAVGVDINPDAIMVARNRLDFSYATLDADYVAPEIKTYVGAPSPSADPLRHRQDHDHQAKIAYRSKRKTSTHPRSSYSVFSITDAKRILKTSSPSVWNVIYRLKKKGRIEVPYLVPQFISPYYIGFWTTILKNSML